jgi:PAS domain S-box-containing protein
MKKKSDRCLTLFSVMEKEKHEILRRWVEREDIQTILTAHQIKVEFFSKHFGIKIIEYVLGVLQHKNEIGNCPVIGAMLHFFGKKNIPLEDIYTLCTNLKNTFTHLLLEKNGFNPSLLIELDFMMDRNFTGVIQEYQKLNNGRERSYSSALKNGVSLPLGGTSSIGSRLVFKETTVSALFEALALEEHTLFSRLNTKNPTDSLEDILPLLSHYQSICGQLEDFEEVNYWLSTVIENLKLGEHHKSVHNRIVLNSYLKTLIVIFSLWRVTVLMEESVTNIHYLDESMLDTLFHLQDLLEEGKGISATKSDVAEIDTWVMTLRRIEEQVLTLWLEHPAMYTLFQKYGMEGWYFKENYASSLYERVIDHLSATPKTSSIFTLYRYIDYLRNRDVTSSDLYRFFAIYHQSILKILISHENSFSPLYNTVQEFLDDEYHDALIHFNESIFGKRSDYKGQFTMFNQYQKMIDKSAIVSKGNLDGIITYVNSKFCEVSGYKPEELLGEPHNIVRHPDVSSEVYKELWETIRAKKIFKARIQNRKKNGETYYVDTTIAPILNEENEIIEYVSMRYDVTELVEAVEIANKAKRIRDEFLANMSHEIRTPLNGIIGFVEILLRRDKDKSNQHYLKIINGSAQMLLGIVNDVLDLSKLQSGKFSIESFPFDPVQELSSIVSLFSSKVYEKQQNYRVYIDPKIPRSLKGDGGRIKQVLSNFLSNAIKFTPNGGTIKVKAVYENMELKVLVQDNGIGVNKEQERKIFHPFEQADASITRNFGGTGLGLSISTELITKMGGKIIFRSIEKKGSTFGFELPLSMCEGNTERRPLENRYSSLRSAVVVDPDEVSLTSLIERYLLDYELRTVELVSNVEISLYDLIFCPVSMIQKIEAAKGSIPVIVLDGGLSENIALEEFDRKLISPFLPYEIEAYLNEIQTE